MDRDPKKMALSTDVIMDIILRHLGVKDLLSCRLVSKFWKKAASSELRRRSTMIETIFYEGTLLRLRKCIEQSSDFPFAGLQFNKPWKFNSQRSMKFFQKHGAKFTHLCLDTSWAKRLHELAPFIHHLTRLSILELGMSGGSCPPPVELLDSDAGQEGGQILKLPSVRTVRISRYCSAVNEDVLREVLMAASPSLRIECRNAQPQVLRALEKAGKLRAVSSIQFGTPHDTESEIVLGIDQLLANESPSLTRLDFLIGGCISMYGLERILLSSQHTMKEMHLYGIGLFDKSWDEFPVFTKLTKLSLHSSKKYYSEFLCRGAQGHKFPALRELMLNIPYERYDALRAFLSDGLFVVPSVTKIDFGCYINENGMKMVAQWFPNVTEIRLHYTSYSGEDSPGGTLSTPHSMKSYDIIQAFWSSKI